MNFQKFLDESQAMVTGSQAQMPPLVVGINAAGEEIVLVGSWKDAKEQLNFATLCRMSFMLHDIKEYFFRSEGFMVAADSGVDLAEFVSGDKQIENSFNRQEIVQVFHVTETEQKGKVYTVSVGFGGMRTLTEHLDLEEQGVELGDVMLHLLPPAGTIVTNETKEQIDELIERLRYKKRAPKEDGFFLLLDEWETVDEVAPVETPAAPVEVESIIELAEDEPVAELSIEIEADDEIEMDEMDAIFA